MPLSHARLYPARMTLNPNEQQPLAELRQVMTALRNYLNSHHLMADDTLQAHFQAANEIKTLLGHHDNRLSALSAVLARQYLEGQHDLLPYDACHNHQNASGPDVQCQTLQGARIIGEIKTTVPSQHGKLGAVQVKNIRKDLERLTHLPAEHKYFFVVNENARLETQRLLARHTYDPLIQIVNVAPL